MDQQAGRCVPEPTRVSQEETEKLAKLGRARHEAFNEVEDAHKHRKTTVEGVKREWRRMRNQGLRTGGTFHKNDFKLVDEHDLSDKRFKSTMGALDLEWRREIDEGRATSTGGTFHYGDFESIRK